MAGVAAAALIEEEDGERELPVEVVLEATMLMVAAILELELT